MGSVKREGNEALMGAIYEIPIVQEDLEQYHVHRVEFSHPIGRSD